MNKTLRTRNSNLNIINFVMILGVFAFLTMGCQQINDAVNGNTAMNTNTATNSNSTANSNASSNANANGNATANSNANANTSASPTNSAANTQASNTDTNTATVTKAGVPLTQEEKVFANNLVGTWSDDTEKVIFSKDEIKFFSKSGSPGLSWKYTIVDEKNVEITDERGQKSTATMTFEANNTTLKWKDKMGDFTYKREAAKP